jgi:uncharacterized Tic20 family protein
VQTEREIQLPTQEDRIFAALIHGLGAIGFPFIAPLVGFLIFQDRGGFVLRQAKEGLNFQITVIGVSIVLAVSIVGIPLLFIYLPLAWVVLVFATVQVALGREFRFPLSLRLIK